MKQHVTQIIFSPTGSTRKAADAVCAGLSEDLYVIDLSREEDMAGIPADDVIVAAVPVFGGRIPNTARERLLRLKADGNPAVAMVVYGNRAYDDALLELTDCLAEIGCRVIAAAAFIGEHSMLRGIASGRPDRSDLSAAAAFAEQVGEKLAQSGPAPVTVPGDASYRNKKAGNGMRPKAGKACVSCGLCAENCPVSAIPLSDPKVTGKGCIGCMRCTAVCPNSARSLAKPVKLIAGLALSGAKKQRKEPEFYL